MTYIPSSGGTYRQYGQFKREFASGKLFYLGVNLLNTAIGTDATWKITKFVYDIDNNIKEETLTGAWDSRSSLSWTIN